MYKNISLFTILTILIGIAYYTEEIKKRDDSKSKSVKTLAIKDFANITRLKLNDVSFVKINDQWRIKDSKRSLDHNYFKILLQILKNLTIHKKINDPENEIGYIGSSQSKFEYKIGNDVYKYILGDVSQITGNFYLKINNDIFISSDKSIYDSPYRNQLDLKLRKYVRFKKLLNSDRLDYLDKKLLYDLDYNKIVKVKVDNKLNRWFSLDLLNNSTYPKAYKKIKVKKLLTKLTGLLNQLIVSKIIENQKDLLSNELSRIELFLDNNKKIVLKLYSSLNGRFSRYVQINDSDKIYEIEIKNPNIFLLNVQDFWNKKFVYDVDLSSLDQMKFEVSTNNNEFYTFIIKDIKNEFKIESLTNKVQPNQTHMNVMFNLLFNLLEFKEANYVEPNIKIDNEMYNIKIKLLNKTLSIFKNKTLISVIDEETKVKYYFNYNTQVLDDDFFNRIFTVVVK